MSELQALQIMSLPIVPTYPNLFLDNIWSIQFEHGMTTRWRCTSAKISMKGKADWSLCFKIGLVLLVTKTQYPKRPILRTAFTHTWPPCLSSASLPCFGVAESLVGALGHLEEKMYLYGLFSTVFWKFVIVWSNVFKALQHKFYFSKNGM